MVKGMKLVLIAITFGLFAQAAQAKDAPMEIAGATTVDAQQLIGLLDKHPNLVIVDSRKATDFDAGHIEGAVLLTNTDMTEDNLAKVVAGKDVPVVFYCNGVKCGRAAEAVEKAVGFGYKTVYYYAKGVEEWGQIGMPLVKK